jgi:hypothetical protein
MPQTIEVPGVGPVQFPDGMSDADIIGAIQKMAPPKPDPAAGIGAAEAGLIGAGKGADRIMDGITQLYLGARGEKSALGGLAQQVAEKDASYAPLKEAHPFTTALGENVPAMIPGGSALKTAGLAAIPGLASYGDAFERLKAGGLNAAGSLAGTALGQAAGHVLKPAGQAVQGLSQSAVGAAERLGVKLSPGQFTQNPAMQAFENYLARSPGSSGAMQAKKAANDSALNTAAAKSMGQKASDLGEDTFKAAKDAIGKEFARLEAATAPVLGGDFLKTVASVDAANAARGSFKSAQIDSLIDKSLDLAFKQKLSGTAYKEIRTQIADEAQAAFKAGDATLGRALKSIRNSLDDAAKASLNKTDQEAWDVARKQWAAYKDLTKGAVAEGGNVSPARLAATMRGKGDGLRTGEAKGELADIARLGESLKGVPNPTSGQLGQQMLYNNPITGIPMMIGNRVTEAIYGSKPMSAYLKKGLLDIGEGGQHVLDAAMRPVGLLGLQRFLGAQQP